jgi:simple sugar transport system ATP-binding protein/ribose transport system ATP-binding protein
MADLPGRGDGTGGAPPPVPAHVELRAVGKSFGGAQALAGVDLAIAEGTIHALVGENGAGKSTLGKVIAGVVRLDAGAMEVHGEPVHFHTPRDAQASGITMIAQELATVPQLSVLENVFLGAERAAWVHRGAMRERYAELDEQTGFGLSPDARVGDLRLADQQKVEILRALARDARLIVMDEPTAVLTADEAEKLFAIMRRLRERGTTIIYVSHFLEEVLALADAVTVLKDGALVRTGPASAETPATLVEAMLGHALELTFPPKRYPPDGAETVLEVRGISRRGAFQDISFDVRAGEIVGIAGLVGAGRSEVAHAVFGALRTEAGEISLAGTPLRGHGPADAVAAGIALLPESRKDQGLLMRSPVDQNITLASLGEVSRRGFIRGRAERQVVGRLAESVTLRADRLDGRISELSGGNQQKALFAKWLVRRPKLLIVDEPTRGVDVGAKLAIHELIAKLAAEGVAVLLISSEFEEVAGLAHRVVVMRAGRIAARVDGARATEDVLMRAAFATADDNATATGD